MSQLNQNGHNTQSQNNKSTKSTRNTKSTDIPSIEVIPARSAVRSDGVTELDVLVRIVPPQLQERPERPLLNIGLVIDHSGSMGGSKLRAAQQAAAYAVQQLLPQDRLSVTIFDNDVETIVPSTLATDKAAILRKIGQIHARGGTALYAGWFEGGIQVSEHQDVRRLNRVLLLTDGLANVGETRAERIARDVHGLSSRGVSTTTMGVGNDFDEDLLEAMANSGDGHTYFIEGPGDFDRIFGQELQGLMATVGTKVSLGIEPQHGVRLLDVFNDLELNLSGHLRLPNLLMGSPIEVVLRLSVPPQAKEADLCFFRLAWDAAEGEAPEGKRRQVVREALCLPGVSSAQWEELPLEETVRHQVVRLEAVRMRRQAIAEMERGNIAEARAQLQVEREYMSTSAAEAPWLSSDIAESAALDEDLEKGEVAHATKAAKNANYLKRRSR
jgi:Ca-activated chloride channel family protein